MKCIYIYIYNKFLFKLIDVSLILKLFLDPKLSVEDNVWQIAIAKHLITKIKFVSF